VSTNLVSDDGAREVVSRGVGDGPAGGFLQTSSKHRFPWYVRLFFWKQRRRYGEVLEPARLWGRSPKVFAALAINWCAFCVDINSATVLRRGIAEEKLAALDRFESSPLFSTREKAALAYAEAVTFSDRRTSSEHFTRLRAHFDDDAIIELTALVAFQNLSSKFNAALGVEPQGFCAAAPQPRPAADGDPQDRAESG
jgi:hypothetical protein